MQPYNLIFCIILLLGACKKNEPASPAASNTDKPVVEYIRYTIEGKHFPKERINLENVQNKVTECSWDGQAIGFSMMRPDNLDLMASFGITASSEGEFDLKSDNDNGVFSTVFLFLDDHSQMKLIANLSCKISINHFPYENSDYIVGTFSGTFTAQPWSNDTLTVSDGSFRMMRKR
jgi:hypothetical protein